MISDGNQLWLWHPAKMPLLAHPTALILKHPGAFALRTLKGFRANQGL